MPKKQIEIMPTSMHPESLVLVNKCKLHKTGIPPMCFVKKKILSKQCVLMCLVQVYFLCLTSLGKQKICWFKENIGGQKRYHVLPPS